MIIPEVHFTAATTWSIASPTYNATRFGIKDELPRSASFVSDNHSSFNELRIIDNRFLRALKHFTCCSCVPQMQLSMSPNQWMWP